MAKRKKTDIVQFKLRLREALRKRLETEAAKAGRSLNNEAVRRLEGSFEQEGVAALMEVLLSSKVSAEFLKSIATILGMAGPGWYKDDVRIAVFAAIQKVASVFVGASPSTEQSFPHRGDRLTADYLAWKAIEDWIEQRIGAHPTTGITDVLDLGRLLDDEQANLPPAARQSAGGKS
ncbi:MAG: Arc family DNA-binding protein [Xanthobacteraceae bacterium]